MSWSRGHFTGAPPSPRWNEPFQDARKCREIGQLGRPRELTRLTEAIDPHGGDAELPAGGDVMEQAGSDVHVAAAIHPGSFTESLPVSVRGLVSPGLRGRDGQVWRHADRL